MPGTFASIIGTVIWMLLPGNNYFINIFITFCAIVPGYFVIKNLEKSFEEEDPSWIVIDEIAGIWVTLLIISFLQYNNLVLSIFGLILFRVLDIIKPYPVGKVENLNGAKGIMADDILAGILSGLIVILIVGL